MTVVTIGRGHRAACGRLLVHVETACIAGEARRSLDGVLHPICRSISEARPEVPQHMVRMLELESPARIVRRGIGRPGGSGTEGRARTQFKLNVWLLSISAAFASRPSAFSIPLP